MVQMDCQIKQIKNLVEDCFPARILEKTVCQTVWGDELKAGTEEFPPRFKSERGLFISILNFNNFILASISTFYLTSLESFSVIWFSRLIWFIDFLLITDLKRKWDLPFELEIALDIFNMSKIFGIKRISKFCSLIKSYSLSMIFVFKISWNSSWRRVLAYFKPNLDWVPFDNCTREIFIKSIVLYAN